MRPSSAAAAAAAAGTPAQGKLRPQSAALLLLQHKGAGITPAAAPGPAVQPGKTVAAASSEELIRDLEDKVRKVVELKRGESDRLRFAVGKKRGEADKARLVLLDLLKDSEALGLRYHPTGDPTHSPNEEQASDANSLEEEPDRLQPIASISRRPVYSKRTKISELEARLEKRAKETHEVQRSTLVLEHIRRRLASEHAELSQTTNGLKAQFIELSHETQELLKKDIAASDAVSQAQARLAQQKGEMVANMRNYKSELEMRHKWAREKAKFEKYYNDQVLAVQRETQPLPEVEQKLCSRPSVSPGRRRSMRGISPQRTTEKPDDSEENEACRQAFLRIGFGHRGEEIDPREIIQTFLSHEQLLTELEAQHRKDTERVSQLQKQITQSRSITSETIPLSKRGTSQRLETKEVEVSSVERSLATVVDQYMFVDQSVRPIKIGLQQVLQNVRNETVNVDDIDELERLLTESCEEMMRLVREAPDSTALADQESESLAINTAELSGNDEVDKLVDSQGVFSAEEFTSPFNIRVSPKAKTPYFVLGVTADAPLKPLDEETEEVDFNVLDRVTVKRISSVLMSTGTTKKQKDSQSNAS